MDIKEIRLDLNNDTLSRLLGHYDENLRVIEKELNVELSVNDGLFKVYGDPKEAEQAVRLLNILKIVLERFKEISSHDLLYLIELVRKNQQEQFLDFFNEPLTKTYHGKHIYAKTLGQKQFIDAMNNNDLVFAIGPAGTGKTYLAMAMAITAFKNNEVNRIIMTRTQL